MPVRRASTTRVTIAGLVVALGLVVVGWFDYNATRQELLALLVDQASSLRQTVAAAARSNEAAAAQAQASLAARLLDNARLLGELDRRRELDQATLDRMARDNKLFRVAVFAADGSRQMAAGESGMGQGPGQGQGLGRGGPGPGSGQGGPGQGFGRGGPGQGFGQGGQGLSRGLSALAGQLLAGSEPEAVSQVHGSRWDRGWRIAAGVRRAGGGAIVLNVDAGDVAGLQQQASLDHLISDIASSAGEIAYIALEDGTSRLAHGPLAGALPDAAAAGGTPPAAAPAVTTREIVVGGQPVLEFAGPVAFGSTPATVLRLGLKLDGLKRAERRTLTRLALSLAGALLLGLLAVAVLVLRQEYGELSEQHALAQEALRRRDRLAAMGELASTVAHEVRNPLNAIGMSIQRLRREFTDALSSAPEADRAELQELLGIVTVETQRLDRIVQQFLEYARPPKLAPRRTDLAALLSDAAGSLRASAAARGVTIETDLQGAGEAVIDRDQCMQALDNLIRNAIEASPAGGRVALRARSAPGGHVIEVEDQGPGIPPDQVPRIFDLYFTTKADGTGVGLAVTHQIVDAHGGRIDVQSGPGRGTRMTIHLPDGTEEADRA